MGWIYLLIAAVIDVVWVLTLKSTEGYTKLIPSLLNFSLVIVDVWVLARAVELLPTATAYGVWTGLTATGVAIFAYYLQGEEFGIAKILCITLIMSGVAGLHFLNPE